MSQISQNQPSHDEYQEPSTQDNNLPYDYLHNKNIFQYLNTTDNKNIDELLQATRKLQPEFVPIPEISSLKIERDRLVDEIAVKAIVDRLKEALSLCNNKNYINCEEYTKLMDTINSNLDTSVINNTEKKEEDNTSTLLKHRVEVIEDILKKHVKDSDILDILIEVKKLKLYKKQKILQKSVQRGVKNMLTPQDILTLDNNYNIYKDIVIEEGLKRKYEENIEKQKKYKRIAFCKIIEDQYKKMKTYINAKINKKDKIYKCVQTYITSFKKQEQEKQDKIFKERIKNMKHNDIEYKNFIECEKKKRIGYINNKIEEYINTIDINKKEGNITNDKNTKNSIESIESINGIDKNNININKDNNTNKNTNSINKDKIEQPATLNINLYDYQLSAIKWLLYLYNNKYNGIISFKKDSGKTVSLISYILYLIENKNITQPFLIIVPSPTILSNYTYEINKCSSLIKAIEYKGSAEQRKILQTEINQDDTNIILTTYKYIIKDKAYLSKINYLYLIIDDKYNEYVREVNIDKCNIGNIEIINNMINSKYTYKYRLYISNDNKSDNDRDNREDGGNDRGDKDDRDNNRDKDIITNNINNTTNNNTINTHNNITTNNNTTIINNNDTLKYKWSLLNFIIPKIFNTNKNIYDYINKQMNNINEIIDINASEENILISKIDTLLDIFTFRNNINNNNIIENIIKCGMSSAQKSIYKSIFDKIDNNDNNNSNDKDKSNNNNNDNINNIIVDLKRICNHPYLFNGIRNKIENNYKDNHKNEYESININSLIYRVSGKLEVLNRIINKIINNNRIIIIVEDNAMKEIIEEYLKDKNINIYNNDNGDKYDGNTTNNHTNLNTINNNNTIYLLNNKDNINNYLEYHNTIILYDCNINYKELSTNKYIRIYKLITIYSIEEYIAYNNNINNKDIIDRSILYNGNSNDYNISNKELEYIINDNNVDTTNNNDTNTTNNINSITTTTTNNNITTTDNDLLQEEVLVNYREKIKELLDIIINLRDKKGREIIYLFMMLPSSVDYPDYYQIIKNPISIECMKKKEYKNYEEFIEDIMLMIDNAKTYNIEGSIVYSDANIIKDTVINYNNK